MMKRQWLIAFTAAILALMACIPSVPRARADSFFLKLPYAKGERFIVVQAYDSPPTHIKKDAYALDFTQIGCDAYGKDVVAAAAGNVMFLSQKGYNGGYGTEVILDHGGSIVSRYAHMIPDSIVVGRGVSVRQGEVIGRIGDTGLVSGAACADHPGTHLHFAMDIIQGDKTFIAYNPEPISGNIGMAAGRWYLSDNGANDAVSAIVASSTAAAASSASGMVLGASSTTHSAATTSIITAITPLGAIVYVSSSTPTSSARAGFSGGVSAIPPLSSSPPSVVIGQQSSGNGGGGGSGTVSDGASSTDQGNSTSTGIGVSTSTDIGVSTSTNDDGGNGNASGTAASTTASDILFGQNDDTAESVPSWYSDNWFDLSKGFSGTLTALTLKGRTNGTRYVAAQQFSLQEFRDASYTVKTNEFPLTGPWFLPTMATATFSDLSILLKPYFYYRLTTVENLQNGSIILAGTPTTTTGVAMYNEFIYATGRVEYTDPFFPFLIMQGVPATSTLTPPPLTPPTDVAARFDSLGMTLSLSFGTSTDPDWPANPLHYEMNYSTSSMLSDNGWTALASVPVVFGDHYIIGVRARDNYGDISAPATTTWDFPQGFIPYLLSPRLGSASQYFTVSTTSTLRSIDVFVTDFATGAKNPLYVGCSLALFDEYNGTLLASTSADNGFDGYHCGGDLAFSFASSSPMLYPDHRYRWMFTASTGNPSTGAGVKFYGTAADTAGGPFSNSALANARFTLTADGGIIFSN